MLLHPKTAVEVGGAEAVTNLPEGISLLLATDEALETGTTIEPFDAWLTEGELEICLRNGTEGVVGTPTSAIYEIEPRTGIGLQSASRTTSEGLYYRTAVVRMKPGYGLVAEFELGAATEPGTSSFPVGRIVAVDELRAVLRLPEEGWCQLGGERRIAHYQALPDPSANAGQDGQVSERTLLYFAAPAYFSGGWRPESWVKTFGVASVAAAITHIERIGGWSLDPHSARGTAKALRRCVPAGSVYFFDCPLTAPGPYSEYGREIGYGYALKGGW